MISKLRSYAPHILSIVAVAIFISYLWRNAERYRELLALSSWTLLSLIGLAFMFSPINGIINYFFYRALGVFLTPNESVGLAAINTLANQLPFAGGLVTKGIYLKQRHRLAYTHFLSATTALYVWDVAVSGIVGLAVLGYWALVGGLSVPLALTLGFSGMVASLVALWLPLDALSLPGEIGKRLMQLAEGWRMLSRHLRLIGIMGGLKILMTLLFAARLWIAFRALSQDVTYAQCLLFASATVLTRLVAITPGGLGIREGLVAGVASLLGFEAGVSAVAVGLDRLVATSVIVVLGTIYTYILSKKAAGPQGAGPATTGEGH